ncbi:tetraacyldisaccharide 4'-kinase [Methylibium sp.]|uniref:tetraacyldisaccharide 4'-kinase n=1 Tax=Methylibium sp. TaxID=2067992 RepID=UPI003D0D280E
MNADRPRAPVRAPLETVLTRHWLKRGPLACALWPLSVLYGAVVAVRNAGYRLGLPGSEPAGRPVVVVGNRIAGGAGKTPTVIAVLAHLRQRGWRPGVVSRGHGRAADGVQAVRANTPAGAVGDEPLLIHLRSGAPVVVGRDRVAAVRALLAARPDIDVIVADDGLQHRRLARDVEVVVFDARGAGNGWLLPAGPLREPIDTPGGAAATLVLYNAETPSTPLAGYGTRRSLAGAAALAAWWQGEPASTAALHALRGRPLLACAGIAQPQRFFDQLRSAGLEVREQALADHADFAALPWPADTRDVIVTEKDAVKLPADRVLRERPGTRIWVAPLDFSPEPAFFAALDAALAPLSPRREG